MSGYRRRDERFPNFASFDNHVGSPLSRGDDFSLAYEWHSEEKILFVYSITGGWFFVGLHADDFHVHWDFVIRG